MKNEKISSFSNINDLIHFSLCSSYIPFVSGDTIGLSKNKKKSSKDTTIKPLEIIMNET
jgi:hypothetical protein